MSAVDAEPASLANVATALKDGTAPPSVRDRDWDSMSIEELWQLRNQQRPTPQATIEAIVHLVLERGLGSLKEPATIERLSRCDAAARTQMNYRIDRLIELKGLLR